MHAEHEHGACVQISGGSILQATVSGRHMTGLYGCLGEHVIVPRGRQVVWIRAVISCPRGVVPRMGRGWSDGRSQRADRVKACSWRVAWRVWSQRPNSWKTACTRVVSRVKDHPSTSTTKWKPVPISVSRGTEHTKWIRVTHWPSWGANSQGVVNPCGVWHIGRARLEGVNCSREMIIWHCIPSSETRCTLGLRSSDSHGNNTSTLCRQFHLYLSLESRH